MALWLNKYGNLSRILFGNSKYDKRDNFGTRKVVCMPQNSWRCLQTTLPLGYYLQVRNMYLVTIKFSQCASIMQTYIQLDLLKTTLDL